MRFWPLLLLASCVTVEGGRQVTGQRFVGTTCTPGRPFVSVDTTQRQRVRLVFNRLDPCVDTWEVKTTVSTGRALAKPVRVALAIAAGVAVAVPLLAIMAVIAPQGPAYEGSTSASVNQALSTALMIPVIAVGSAVYAATAGPLPLPPLERIDQVEREGRGAVSDVAVTAGVAEAPGLGKRPLVRGSLDLTFADGLRLDVKTLTLDGIPVDVPDDTVERLSWLGLCDRAVQKKTVRLAELCDAHGWGFADEVLARGLAEQKAPTR